MSAQQHDRQRLNLRQYDTTDRLWQRSFPRGSLFSDEFFRLSYCTRAEIVVSGPGNAHEALGGPENHTDACRASWGRQSRSRRVLPAPAR